jgi:hypothetical protein
MAIFLHVTHDLICELYRRLDKLAEQQMKCDAEMDNVCQLTCHFLGRILTDQQLLKMILDAHPMSMNVMVSLLSK